MKPSAFAAAALVLALSCLATLARAEDKPDPTGTWKWTVSFNNQSFEQTLKLKLEGDQLTGTMLGRNNQEHAIEDAKYKDGEVSFTVTRERNGQKFIRKYNGKVSGDTIKGTTESERNGEKQSREWEAKKA